MVEQPENRNDDGEPTKEQKNDATPQAIITLKDTLIKQGDASRQQEGREDWWSKIISLATLFFVICTTAGIFYQDYILHSSDEAAHQSAAAALEASKESKRAADAAIKQSEIATKQAESSDRAAIQAQRAWLGPRDAKLEAKPVAGQKNKIIIEYQNTGREPAVDMVFAAFPFTVTLAEDAGGIGAQKMTINMQNCIKMPPLSLAGVVFPTSGFNAGTLSTFIDEKLIDQDIVDAKKLLIIQGCFAYQTGNITRHSAFCYFYKSDITDIAHLNICVSGNYAD